MDLHTLCIQGDTRGVIERCKLSPASINDLVYGKPALWHAAMRGHKDVVRAMVILGADVNVKDTNNEETALHIACHKGFVDIAMIITSRNREAVHIRDGRYGWQALHHACERGHLELACALVDNGGAIIDAVDKDGWTPMHHACICGFDDVADAMYRRGSSIHKATNNGWTALHLCCRRGLMDFAMTIILDGASINAKDDNGQTPLEMAHPERIDVKALTEVSVRLNKQNRQRNKELDDLKRGYSMYIPPPKKKEKYDPNKRKSLFAEEFDLTVDHDA